MFGSDYLDRFGLPTMPEGFGQPAPLQWQGIDTNPFFGGAGGLTGGQPAPPFTGAAGGSANPSVPALQSGDPLAQGTSGAVGRGSAPDAMGAGGPLNSNTILAQGMETARPTLEGIGGVLSRAGVQLPLGLGALGPRALG